MALDTIISGIVTPDLGSSGTSALVPVGTTVKGTNGSEYIYVIALSAIAQYDVCGIFNSSSATGASIAAAPITTTNAITSSRVGVAQTALGAGGYGWIALAGSNMRASVAISCQPAVPLFTTGTGGVLDDATVSAGYIPGIVAMTSAASASAVPVIMTAGPVETLG